MQWTFVYNEQYKDHRKEHDIRKSHVVFLDNGRVLVNRRGFRGIFPNEVNSLYVDDDAGACGDAGRKTTVSGDL